MKKLFTMVLMLCCAAVYAAPVIDGNTSDADYTTLGTYTQAHSFGSYGLAALKAAIDTTTLTLAINGNCEGNYNELYLFIGHGDATGAAAGVQLPAGSDGGSPFAGCRPTLDFEADFGVRLTNDASQGYVSVIDYRSGGNTDTYVGTIAHGSSFTVASGSYAGMVVGLIQNNDIASIGTDGLEIAFPLSILGASSTSVFQVMAIYGNGDYMSSDTIPEIAGQGGTNLAVNPDFSSIAGDQFIAFPVPEIDVAPLALDFSGDSSFNVWTVTTQTLTVTIENLGTGALNISDLDITGAGASKFSVTPAAPLSVDASDSTTLTVSFYAGYGDAALGNSEAELTITSDDADESSVVVSLSGLAVASGLSTVDLQ